MARLDVYQLPNGTKVVDVQAGPLDYIATHVVVPLVPLANASQPIDDLNPVFDIDGIAHVMQTQAIAGVPKRELRKPIGSLDRHHDQIIRALDVLLLGY